MKVKFGVGNRITIPKDLYKSLGWEIGEELECNIEQGKLTLSSCNKNGNFSECVVKEEKHKDVLINTNHKPQRKIKSNLEEGLNFSRQQYSLCGLVIKTKSAYLRDFCGDCKGQLACEYEVTDKCPFTNKNLDKDLLNYRSKNVSKNTVTKTPKETIKELQHNIDIIDKQLNNKIENIKNSSQIDKELLTRVNKKSEKSIIPVNLEHNFSKCSICNEYFNKGYFVDEDFYCSDCLKKDFKQFLQDYNKIKRERIGNKNV